MDNEVSVAQFITLLQQLENSGTGIRLRLSGKAWTAFCQLMVLSESAMILRNSPESQLIVNVRNVMQFELEEAVGGFKPRTLYEVVYC